MKRCLAALFVLLHGVFSQAPCSSCNRSQADLIGKVTCDAQGNLVAECKKGPIRMEVNGKLLYFDRVTCIRGDWFGTSCDGVAFYLSNNLPASSCPDEDYPEVVLEGTQCKIRPIGLQYAYDRYFAAFPELDSGVFKCEDREQWQRFRKAPSADGGMYVRSVANTYREIHGNSLTCRLNEASGKYQLSADGVFLDTNEVECLYKKCPPFQVYVLGRCELVNPNHCGHAFVVPLGSYEFSEAFAIPALGSDGFSNVSIPNEVTHIAVYPGCKALVEGTKEYPGTTKKIPLLYEKFTGLWEIYNPMEIDLNDFPERNLPTRVIFTSTGTYQYPPALNGVTPMRYTVSHESRYAEYIVPGTNDSFVFDKLEHGFSMSLTGTGTGILNWWIKDTNGVSLKVAFNFQTKQIILNNQASGTRSIPINSEAFHVRYMYHSDNYLFVYLNGHLVWRIYHNMNKANKITLQLDNVSVDMCNFFVPKRCDAGHFFSKTSGDCEYAAQVGYTWREYSDDCSLLTTVTEGTWPSAWVAGDQMPDGFEFKTSQIRLREGCIAYAYNAEDPFPYRLQGDSRLEHWKGRYSFPNYQACIFRDGTCARLERGLKHVECFCEDYNKLLSYAESQQDSISVDVLGGFLFGGTNYATDPIDVIFYNSEGNSPLILTFGNGSLTATSFEEIYTAEFPIAPWRYDMFECRIHLAVDGYEIRLNGNYAVTIPYSLRDRQIVKANIPKKIAVARYRTYETLATPGFMNFADKPLLMGDFIHFNGVPFDGSFSLSLLDADQETVYALEWKPWERKIVQSLVVKDQTFTTESSTCSLSLGVEFDIVLVNKAHSIEAYINGELIKTLGLTVLFPEKAFHYAKLVGQVTIHEQRRGPKKIEREPKWKNNSGGGN